MPRSLPKTLEERFPEVYVSHGFWEYTIRRSSDDRSILNVRYLNRGTSKLLRLLGRVCWVPFYEFPKTSRASKSISILTVQAFLNER